MTTHDLFRCIGDLSDEFIEEAAEVKRRSRWLPIAALAACAVLAISIPLVLHGAPKSASTASDTSAAVERPAEDMPASENETTADAPAAGAESENGSGYRSDSSMEEQILKASLNGLQLGMTSEQVRQLLGNPDSYSNSGPVQREDSLWEICWFYNTSGSADVQYDLKLRFVGTGLRDGSESVLNEVWAQDPCTWMLDTGIGIGSPQEAVDAAYPNAAWTNETAIENDREVLVTTYRLRSGSLYLSIVLEDSVVQNISFGDNGAELLEDETAAPSDPYAFTPYDTLSGDSVTAYLRTETGWEKRTLTGKPAKHIMTALNIMDPEPSDRIAEPVLWLEFPSGGAAALYGDDSSGAIYRIEDAATFEAALESGEDPTASLTLIESCIFPDVWDNVQQALEQ